MLETLWLLLLLLLLLFGRSDMASCLFFSLPYPALPCPALPCPALPCPTHLCIKHACQALNHFHVQFPVSTYIDMPQSYLLLWVK